MSINLEDIDLSQVQTSVTIDTQNKSIGDCSWIELINESDFTLQVNMGSVNVQVLAWESYPIELQRKNGPVWQPYRGADFPIAVTPRLLSTMVSQPFSTILTGVLYFPGEVPSSTSPRPLIRQAFIPNNVGTTQVGSTLINNGNAPLTNVVHLQPSDVTPAGTNPTVSIDNSGNVNIKGDNAGALTELLQIIAGASPAVILAAAGVLTTIAGNLSLAGTINGVSISNNPGSSVFMAGSTVALANDIIDVTTTSAFFKTPNGSFNFQSPSGTNRWTRQAEGKTVGTGNGSFACPFPGSFDIALPNP